MTVSLEAWSVFLVVLVLFGLAPGMVLRLLVKLYPKEDARRRELVAELYVVEFRLRPLFVAQQLETAICEGVPARWRKRRGSKMEETPTATPGGAPLASPLGPEPGFRGPQTSVLVGATYRQLDAWARTDLVRPSVIGRQGRRYSYRDLLELKVVKCLLDAGISLHSARRAVECLRHELGANVDVAHLVIDGSDISLRSGEQVVGLVRGGEGAVKIVALAGVKEELDAAILRLVAPPDDAGPDSAGAT